MTDRPAVRFITQATENARRTAAAAWDEGWQARDNGQPITDNPHLTRATPRGFDLLRTEQDTNSDLTPITGDIDATVDVIAQAQEDQE